jgi:predicted PurR-regulated permease PerM
MNQVNDLINTMTANYGATFTIVIIAILMVLGILTLLVPLFVWSIHNQTSKITKELIKLNHSIEKLSLKQPFQSRKVDENAKEILKENQIESFAKGRLSGQAIRPRKVFYKPDDELPVQKRKTS